MSSILILDLMTEMRHQAADSEMLTVVWEQQQQLGSTPPPPPAETNAYTYILAQFGTQLLQRLFLVFADGLQLKVFILEAMELLGGEQSRGSGPGVRPRRAGPCSVRGSLPSSAR